MSKLPKYFIVDADAMPEIFRKVAQSKVLLETGEADTVNAAAMAVGISRSAYYKYKDSVRPFQDMLHGRIVTFQILLRDEPGILSGVLNIFGGSGGNMEDIIACVMAKNPNARIIVSAIAMESAMAAISAFEKQGISAEIVQLCVSRSKQAGGLHMMTALNPIFIISGGSNG